MEPFPPRSLGLVIGKFYPPHRGHESVIQTALRHCSQVVVIVCGRAGEAPDGQLRRAWLQELFPTVEVRLIDDIYPSDDSQLWADLTRQWLGRAPDAVFTSEDYGDRYAAYLGCRHIRVDPARLTVPCSGTAIRANPWRNWEFLSPPVRAWYALRIVVVGAESTGTTTLSEALARHYQTVWVPEYGRAYSARKQAQGDTHWTTEEFVHIAEEQQRRENFAARAASRLVIGDTNAFATTLWHRRYLGFDSPAVAGVAHRGRTDLYLLTGDEIPFVQDGLRDGEHLRHRMHGWFEDALKSGTVPWKLLRGSPQARLNAAIAEIESRWPIALLKPAHQP